MYAEVSAKEETTENKAITNNKNLVTGFFFFKKKNLWRSTYLMYNSRSYYKDQKLRHIYKNVCERTVPGTYVLHFLILSENFKIHIVEISKVQYQFLLYFPLNNDKSVHAFSN